MAIRCRPELAERVLAELLELAPGGVEEERGEGYVEFAVYGVPGELPALPDVEAVAGEGLVDVTSTEVPDDWADRWRDFHEPVRVADRLVVRPSWRETTAAGAIEVIIDPGQAFGTGAHPTTRMCIELLLELADRGRAGGACADLGTGSGVLAIVAAKLGWCPVIGCDHEPSALEAAAANAAANGVELELRQVNLRQSEPPAAATIVANLTAPLIRELARRIDSHRRPRALVCSGVLATEVGEVEAALSARGLIRERLLSEGDWVALSLAPGAGGKRKDHPSPSPLG